MVCIAKINIWTILGLRFEVDPTILVQNSILVKSRSGQWAGQPHPYHKWARAGQGWAAPPIYLVGLGRPGHGWAAPPILLVGVGGCGRPHPKGPTHLQLGPSGLVRDTAVGVAPSRLLRNDPWWDDVHSKRSLTNGTGIRLGSSWYSGLNTYFKFYSDTEHVSVSFLPRPNVHVFSILHSLISDNFNFYEDPFWCLFVKPKSNFCFLPG